MPDDAQTLTLTQVATWLRESAGWPVQGQQGAVVLRDADGHPALTLRENPHAPSVALTVRVTSLPGDERLAALLQWHLLRLCADPHDLHGMRLALSADATQVLLLDPHLQVANAQALLDRCELALEMASALGADIDALAADPAAARDPVRPDALARPGDAAHILLP